MVDRGLEHLALGREPESIVDELGIFGHQLVLQMRRAAVERDAFDAAMRARIDFAARRFIHAARLHADEAVLDEVEAADAMLAAEVVQGREQRRGRHRLPRSEEHTSELQSLMRISYAVFC